MFFNPDKCHFIVPGDQNYTCVLTCNGKTKEYTKNKKF